MIRHVRGKSMSNRGRRFAMWCALGLFVLYALDSFWKAVGIVHEGITMATAGVPWWAITGVLVIRLAFMGFLLYAYFHFKRTSTETR
jgi:hypothetical protein